ncbi:unnamed protein product [Prorocentrum cordatum]|uniref:Uncharacterized protein n=1 Tax=Prorocentrum cordatum TaxID=2364126 RepID=A0ABN9SPL9_9DINO|nr:unnamed protein product [Polarella glacialis]
MMVTGCRPSSWRPPTSTRASDTAAVGAPSARRLARRRRRDACEAWLRSRAGAAASGSWQDREQAARPALVAAAAQRRVPGRARRRCNASLHARRVPPRGFCRASEAELAWAAAGERLGQQDRGTAPAVPRLASPLLKSDALSFVPGHGPPWIYTCGATVFSPPSVAEYVADVVQPQVAESQEPPSEESPRAPPTLSPLSPPSSPSLMGGEEVLECEVEENINIPGPSSLHDEADLQGSDEASVSPLLTAQPVECEAAPPTGEGSASSRPVSDGSARVSALLHSLATALMGVSSAPPPRLDERPLLRHETREEEPGTSREAPAPAFGPASTLDQRFCEMEVGIEVATAGFDVEQRRIWRDGVAGLAGGPPEATLALSRDALLSVLARLYVREEGMTLVDALSLTRDATSSTGIMFSP